MKTIISIPEKKDRRWKAWAKLLTGIDKSKSNGYAYQGDWLKLGRKVELEVGALVIVYQEEGSAKYHQPNVTIHRVEVDGLSDSIYEHVGKDWALELRDLTFDLLADDFEVMDPENEQLTALRAIVALPQVREYLELNNPEILTQAISAIGETQNDDDDPVQVAFHQLKKELANNKLPTSTGELRQASADEFMYMQTANGFHQFKHSDTRNYVLVNAETGVMEVPQTDKPFFKGEFDLLVQS